MSKLLIVAGKNSKNLRDFMTERGTFEVPFYYESLSKNSNEIKNSIIKVDKMLYLYQPDEISIRYDMGILKNLLAKSSFFDPGEITCIVNGNPDENTKAIEYFKSVMEDVGYTNYQVKRSESTMTYEDIYNQLLGVTESVKFKNKRKNVYRVENSNESKEVFLPELDTGLTIEPFDYESNRNYEKAKENTSRTESGIEYVDSMKPMKKFVRPSFGSVSFDSILHGNKTICISGLAKSGITTWTCALATSAIDLGKSLLVLDYTDNQDIYDTMVLNRIKCKQYSMIELLQNCKVEKGVIGVCGLTNEKERNVKSEFLQNFFSRVDTYDYVFIVTSINYMEKAVKIVGDMLSKLFLCTSVIQHDVELMNTYVSRVVDKAHTMVILNNVINVMDDSILLDDKTCKEILANQCKVVSPIKFEDLHLGAYFCIKLLEV